MLLSLRATPVVCKAYIIDKAVCVYVGWGDCALESARQTQLKIARGTADVYKVCTRHGTAGRRTIIVMRGTYLHLAFVR